MVQIVMQTQMEALQVGEMPKREDVAAFHKMTHIAVNSLLRVFLCVCPGGPMSVNCG